MRQNNTLKGFWIAERWCNMCNYDPFWIYDAILEQEYLERMEEEEEEELEESEADSGD